jgi:uncharacterized protein YndB with AHSA1/START domain
MKDTSRKDAQVKAAPAARAAANPMVITRLVNAPRERVWKAWTDPEQVKKWWGPKPFTSPVAKIDLRVGGRYLLSMHSPDGQNYFSGGTYREIVPLVRTVADDEFTDEHGKPLPRSAYGWPPELPAVFRVTFSLADEDGKTRVTVRYQDWPPSQQRDQARLGWNSQLDRLEELLLPPGTPPKAGPKTTFLAPRGRQEVIIKRAFRAPRQQVFQAIMDAKALPQWWGPADLVTTVEAMDVRPGGKWRFIQKDNEGHEFSFHGWYHHVSSPERLVSTSEYEGAAGHITLETIDLVEKGGGTLLTRQMVFQSVADRDAMMALDMEKGLRAAMDRLAKLLWEE